MCECSLIFNNFIQHDLIFIITYLFFRYYKLWGSRIILGVLDVVCVMNVWMVFLLLWIWRTKCIVLQIFTGFYDFTD